MADVFISYSRADYDDFVKTFADDLRAEGIDVWIDQHNLKPGTPDWEQAIRDAIKTTPSLILVATENSAKSLHVKDELALARANDKAIYPLWANGEDKRFIDSIPLGYGSTQYVDARGENYKRALHEIIQVIRGEKSIPTLTITANFIPSEEVVYSPTVTLHEPIRPYKGLESFKEADKAIFFGREALSETLTSKIQTIASTDSRLLAVVGASGSGKSSVVMAGMIPRLREQTDWLILDPITPGAKPLRTLALILSQYLSRPLTSILDDLRHPLCEGLDLIARAIGNKKHILLYIDQFEETFTLIADEAERQQFINLLVTAATEPNGSLVVMLSLRADFYDRPMNYSTLGQLIENNSKSVLPMTLSELVDAVERPAALANLHFESGLVSEIAFALREKSGALAGALPLLQFALERLYDERSDNTLTHSAYERIGGIEGAIGNYAESIFTALDETVQNALGTVFRNLINAGDPPTRKRVRLAEVTKDEASKALVDALINSRLLITGRDEDESVYVEVAHEALLRTWTRLAAWIASVADDLRLLDEVKEAAQKWNAAGRPDYLWWKHEQLAPVYDMLERLHLSIDGSMHEFMTPEAERLLEEFVNPDTKEHRQLTIVDRWRMIGEPAANGLLLAIHHKSEKIRRNAAEALKDIGEIWAIEGLLSALRDENENVREAIAQVLQKMKDEQTLAGLFDAVRDEKEYVRAIAARILGKRGEARATPVLLETLGDLDAAVRENSAIALGEISDTRSVEMLIIALSDVSPNVRWNAAYVLGKIGDTRAVPALLIALKDPDNHVRGLSAEALGMIKDVRAISPMTSSLLDTTDDLLRIEISNALWGFDSNLVVESIVSIISFADADLRGLICSVFGGIKNESAVPALFDLLMDQTETKFQPNRVCYHAANALESIGTPKAIETLRNWRDYEEWKKWHQEIV